MPPATVLWIDDDRLLLGIGTDALHQAGYRVLTAPDGPAGITLAKQEHPDLILLDVIMPSMYGIEVCKELRADPALQATPIVLLTAFADVGVVTMGAQVQATRVLRKPFGVGALLQVLADLLPGRSSLLLAPGDDAPGSHGRKAAASTRRVLIVDDEQPLREALRTSMELGGYEVHEAADGPEGLDKAEQLVPDVIFLEVRLPGIDGYEVCQGLKANPATKHIPVIFITAARDRALHSRVTAAGGAACLTKPFRLETLLGLTQTVIENAGR